MILFIVSLSFEERLLNQNPIIVKREVPERAQVVSHHQQHIPEIKPHSVEVSNADESDLDSSPSTPRNATSGEETTAAGPPSSSPLLLPHYAKKKSGGKLHFAFNLLKSVRSETNDDEGGSDSEINEDNQDTLSVHEAGGAGGGDRRSRLSIKHTSSKLYQLRQRVSTDSIDEDQGATTNANNTINNTNVDHAPLYHRYGHECSPQSINFTNASNSSTAVTSTISSYLNPSRWRLRKMSKSVVIPTG
ncbi:unnamed protein product [Anisakis simplex]|uniref:Serine/threonine-protein kinase DDB_G0282963 n=1 Tax=Anisakis simplex TaxID=6269 RepID=A0A0M3KGF1_ANISI|nr:unnamed protein product [Anisakis simplex]